MLETLFSSKVLFKILAFLYQNNTCAVSTPEIIKSTGKNQANILRELQRLIKLGLVTKTKQGNQNVYALNIKSEYFAQLQSLFAQYNSGHNKKYILINEEGGTAILPWHFFLNGFCSSLSVSYGILKRPLEMLLYYQGNYGKAYFEKESWHENAKDGLRRLLEDHDLAEKVIYPRTVEIGKEMLALYKSLSARKFRLDKKEALKVVGRFIEAVDIQISLNSIAVFDLFDQPFSNYLKKYLSPQVQSAGLSLNEVMEKLLAPPYATLTQELRLEMLRLARQVKQSENRNTDKLKDIHNNWQWLNFGYRGPAMDLDFFNEYLSNLLKKAEKDLAAEVDTILNLPANVKAEKEKLFTLLKIDSKHRGFINSLGLLSYLKVYRKDIAFLVMYSFYEVIKPFATAFKNEQWQWLTLWEIKKVIKGELKINVAEIKKRAHESIHLSESGHEQLFVGAEVKKVLHDYIDRSAETLPGNADLRLLEGTTACLGATGNWVYGEVKIINTPGDMIKMNHGDILISIATTPDVVPAMKKAGAIVTDHGGITSHAAIVSRELNVPCLIGTKYATKLFKDGDKVVVCPRHGYIKFQ